MKDFEPGDRVVYQRRPNGFRGGGEHRNGVVLRTTAKSALVKFDPIILGGREVVEERLVRKHTLLPERKPE